MTFYPFTTPKILTDNAFVMYGGQTGTSTAAQRQAAYLVAEMVASDDLDTLLVPTRLTGSYHPASGDQYMLTEFAYVSGFHLINIYDLDDTLILSVSGSNSGWFNVRNWDLGQVDLFYPIYYGLPYRVDYVYDAGLPTGTSCAPNVLMALTTYANILLNEMQGYGNEAPGDIGVQSFSDQQYREDRVALIRTSFGNSAKGNFAHKLLSKLRKHRFGARGL